MTIAEIMWLIVVAYAGVQVTSLLESHGQTRIAFALPLLFMVPILLAAFSAMQNDHHPTLLFTASPLALTYLVYVDYRSFQLPTPSGTTAERSGASTTAPSELGTRPTANSSASGRLLTTSSTGGR